MNYTGAISYQKENDVSTVHELHNEAMKLAQLAKVARANGQLQSAKDLSSQAYKLEFQAAARLSKNDASEPTRSILYLSAASLALQCEQSLIALQFAAEGLSGNPPYKIRQALIVLFEQIVTNIQERLQSQPSPQPTR